MNSVGDREERDCASRTKIISSSSALACGIEGGGERCWIYIGEGWRRDG